jgi:hypothetical protein
MDPLSLDAVSVVSPNCRALYEECVRGQNFGYLDLTGTQFFAPRYTAEAGSARA